MENNKCASNYADPSSLESDRLYNNICSSREIFKQKNKSILNKQTSVGIPEKYK